MKIQEIANKINKSVADVQLLIADIVTAPNSIFSHLDPESEIVDESLAEFILNAKPNAAQLPGDEPQPQAKKRGRPKKAELVKNSENAIQNTQQINAASQNLLTQEILSAAINEGQVIANAATSIFFETFYRQKINNNLAIAQQIQAASQENLRFVLGEFDNSINEQLAAKGLTSPNETAAKMAALTTDVEILEASKLLNPANWMPQQS